MNKHFSPTTIELLHNQFGAEACPDPIRDDYNQLDDPDLIASIEAFQAEGIDVFVDLTKTMRDEGYSTSDDMSDDEFYGIADQYIEEYLEEGCQAIRVSDNYMIVVRAHEDGLLQVVTTGQTNNHRDQNWNEFEGNVDQLFDDMVADSPDTLQDDTAEFLDRLHDDMFPDIEPSSLPEPGPASGSSSTTNETNQPQPVSDIDLPVAEVGFATTAAMVLGGGAFVVKNKRNARSMRIDFDEFLNKKDTAIDMIVSIDELDPTSPIVTIPESDIPELTALHQEIIGKQAHWKSQRDIARSDYARVLKGLSPNTGLAGVVESQFKMDTIDQDKLLDAFRVAHNQAIEARDSLQDRLLDTKALLDTVSKLAKTLQTTGVPRQNKDSQPYTMSTLSEELGGYNKSYTEIAHMANKEGLVMQPTRRLDELEAILTELKAIFEEVPNMHDTAAENTARLNAHSDLLDTQYSNTESMVTAFKTKYGESNHADVASNLELLASRKAQLQNRISELGSPDDIYDVEQLQAITGKISGIDNSTSAFDEILDDIETHISEVERIAAEAPELMEILDDDIDEAIEYSRKHAEHIEDDTEDLIYQLEHEMDALYDLLEAEKPNYLEIDRTRQKIQANLDDSSRQAESERQEMLNLIRFIDEGMEEFHDDLARLEAYERSNSDVDYDTEQDIDDIEAPDIPSAVTREELRAAKRLIEEALEEVEDVFDDARSDVAREEQRRREAARKAREAKLAKERAERRRKQQAEQRRERQERQRSQRAASRRRSSPSRSSSRRRG